MFPFDGSTSRLSPSLPWVLRGGVSQVQQYYETLRLPRTQTGRLMDSSLGSSPSPRLRSVRYEDASCRLAPGLRSDAVRPWFSAGNTGTSQSLPPRRRGFLGCPSCAYALLFDPGRTSTPHQLGVSVLPPYPIRRRLPRRTISGLDHTALAPAVYASRQVLRPAMPDSLAAGGEPLPRGS